MKLTQGILVVGKEKPKIRFSSSRIFVIGIFILVAGLEAQKVGTKAASNNVNCGCQCSNLTFRDKYGKVQGNCKR